jgi:predicted transcriptional regulator
MESLTGTVLPKAADRPENTVEFRMLVESVLAAAREWLVTIDEDAPVVAAAKLLSSPHINLIIVCNSSGAMIGGISKTGIVKHISHCHGNACAISVMSVMTRHVVAYAVSAIG